MPTLAGNLYRCRVSNEFGRAFSNSSALSIVPGYTWTPPDPFALFSLLAVDTYSGCYNSPGSYTGLASGLVGPNFSTAVGANSTSAQDILLFSVFFNTAGAKAFAWDVSITGAWMAGPFNNGLRLYSLDGSTLIDQDPGGTDGPYSTTKHLNVPAAGQYLIFGDCLRAGLGVASIVDLSIGYTLGGGDSIATVV